MNQVEECQPLLPKNDIIGIFKRRWAFLFGIFLLNSASMFSSVCFGLIDDIFTGYFNISYALGDWITLAVYVTSCLAVPVLAWLSFANRMGIRLLIVTESLCLTFSYLLIVLAIAFPKFYQLIIFGQLIHGVTNAIQWSIPPLFAVLWFPNHEVGIAIAANFIGAALGAGIGFILPPRILAEPLARHYVVALNSTNENFGLYNGTTANNYWKNEDRLPLLILFSTTLTLSTLLLLFFFIFLTDLPPKPPTIAQALKRTSQSEETKSFNKANIRDYYVLWKSMFSDKIYIFLLIVYSVIHRAVMLEFTLMGELIRVIIPSVPIEATTNEIGSYIMVLYPIFAATGSVTSGKLLDKYAKFQRQATIGAGMTFVSTFGIAISYYFKSFIGICVFNGGFGFSTRICIISLLAVVTRHTYPVAEAFVSIWVTGFKSFVLIAISEMGRVLIKYVDDVSVLIFMCSSVFLSFILALVTKPRDRRLEAEEEAILQERAPSSSSTFSALID